MSRNVVVYTTRKGKRSEAVMWQKPLYDYTTIAEQVPIVSLSN